MYSASPSADPTAVLGRRIGAFVINLAIVAVALVATTRGMVDLVREDIPAFFDTDEVCEVLGNPALCFVVDDTVYYSDQNGAIAAVLGVPALISFLNSVVLAGLTGASVGKHVFGLRVVKAGSGAPAGVGAHLVRWLLWIVDAFPWCLPLVGLITGLATKGHRRVGDMAAGTLVVAKSSVGQLSGASPAAPWGGWTPPAAGAPGAPETWAPPAPSATGDWAPPAPAAADPWSPPAAAAPPADPWSPPVPAPAPEPAPAPAPASSGPQWDPARNAYIQWEPTSAQWMQYDAAAGSWHPIS